MTFPSLTSSAVSDRPRVLVIDDDPLFRSLLVSMLRREYLVFVASDGAEGYYKAAEHPPDLAIVDIQMPGWDGLKTITAFKSHQQLCNIPLVVLTSDASRETVMAAIHAGADDYVIKTSFSREDIHQKLARLRQAPASTEVENPALAGYHITPQPGPVALPVDAKDPLSSFEEFDFIEPEEITNGAPLGLPPATADRVSFDELLDAWE